MTPENLMHLLSNDQASHILLEQLTNACQGSLVIDRECRIVWISEAYRKLLALSETFDATGLPVERLLPTSQMPRVVQTGKPMFVDLMEINNHWCVVNRLPLRNEAGDVVGALGLIFHNDLDELQPLFDKFARLRRRFEQENLLRTSRYQLDDIIGQSPQITQMKRQAQRAAQLDTTLLLLGETGTGKELLAQGIHQASPRSNAPFVGINMAALPEPLAEAELFGTAAGAYTGADRKGRIGKIQLADGGTLFLDEIAEMPLAMQAKLLRVLQEREVEALGSNRLISVDVRIIAATSKNLADLVERGLFRADLYYRLHVLPIHLPPLRARQGDIALLAEHLLQTIQRQTHLPALKLSGAALDWLNAYHWPGNVRELRNRLERACVMAEGEQIGPMDLGSEDPISTLNKLSLASAQPDKAPVSKTETVSASDLKTLRQRHECQLLEEALHQHQGNRTAAAKSLGISRATFYNRIRRCRTD
ncbi:sigma-54 interaction domain-containing protein [Oceanospirillum linum]|uniref:Sigma-54-dependent Fis family transcriptional regulator n=1 Tax=Oceanospirillum linum TaxID=966 RepID=A0A1T1HB89_OCELI|nr:sigma 54-interacting transcriptional regulator [Oceanospirillum linum]OOV87056.1 sigma-54-dependent Fis family transcriptional regulator [Oceanospirillum linum]SEF73053.1 Transcriptional regulator containing PAS, AAA-type ATPase, and DNA-binding Fis domains [Oleiphilus messinensis]SMP16124.1 Transcriptional regulator containing PAS, AAA-type ATPase, and DNA-binding Fis domains [Oceanospirillum linum]